MSAINNLRKTAMLLGVNRTTLMKWLDQGCPFVARGDRDLGHGWQINFADVIEWRTARAVSDAMARQVNLDGSISKEEADRRRAVAMAILAEVEADEMLRSVMSRADADETSRQFTDAIRQAVMAMIPRFSEQAATIADPSAIRDAFERNCNDAFRAAEAELRRIWDRPKADCAA